MCIRDSGSADLCLEGRWDAAEFSVMAYNDFGRHVFSDGWNSRDYYRGMIARGSLALTPAHRLSFGLDARFFGGKSYNSPKGEWTKNDIGVYLHDEIALGKRWILTAGARLDRDSLFGCEASPQAGLVWHAAEKTSVRLSAAKAFRTPHLSELFLFPSSNPDLEPERAWNYELGFSQSIAGFLTIDAAVFKMNGTNLIETVRNPAGPAPYINRNTGSFDFAGIELGFKADVLPSLSLGAAYSRLDAGDLTKGRPGRKIDLDLRWKSGPFQAYLTGQAVSDYYADNRKTLPISSYTLINGRVEFAVTRTVGLFVELNNIGGEAYWIYADLSGQAAGLYEMPGRNAHFGIRVGL
jgi:outer membrane receptor protein involved in Fe transport